MNCARCQGLMHAEEFRDWHCGMGTDRFQAFRCLVCGEIVDLVIVQNRNKAVEGTLCLRKRRARRGAPVLAMGVRDPLLRRSPDTRTFSRGAA